MRNKRLAQIRKLRAQAKRPKPHAVDTVAPEPVVKAPDIAVTIGVASMPERERGLLSVIRKLLPQCDSMHVSLNGYPSDYRLPINDDKLVVHRNPAEAGPAAKFAGLLGATGYYLSVDDDLIYSDNYVERIVAGVEKFERNAMVGYHGLLYTRDTANRHVPFRCLFRLQDDVRQDIPCHVMGTGVAAFHTSKLRFDWRKLLPGKIDDQVGAILQELGLPVVTLEHPSKWLYEDKSLRFKGNPMRKNSEALRDSWDRVVAREWHIFLPPNWRKYHH